MGFPEEVQLREDLKNDLNVAGRRAEAREATNGAKGLR